VFGQVGHESPLLAKRACTEKALTLQPSQKKKALESALKWALKWALDGRRWTQTPASQLSAAPRQAELALRARPDPLTKRVQDA
jgi:hypothetical protein